MIDLLTDWVRYLTPAWSDEQRYHLVSTVHASLSSLGILFFLCPTVLVRSVLMVGLTITVVTEILFGDCIITAIEHKLSTQTWEDIFDTILRSQGVELPRSIKMAYITGANLGVLICFSAFLLTDSMNWMVGLMALGVVTLLALVLTSSTPPLQEVAELRLDQTHFPPVSQSFVHILRPAVG